jgi:hypothetical protein
MTKNVRAMVELLCLSLSMKSISRNMNLLSSVFLARALDASVRKPDGNSS